MLTKPNDFPPENHLFNGELIAGNFPKITDAAHTAQAHCRECQLQIWSAGFSAAWGFLSPRLARANADADRLHYQLHNSAEIRAQHAELLKSFDVARARASAAEQWAELDRVAAERSEANRG